MKPDRAEKHKSDKPSAAVVVADTPLESKPKSESKLKSQTESKSKRQSQAKQQQQETDTVAGKLPATNPEASGLGLLSGSGTVIRLKSGADADMGAGGGLEGATAPVSVPGQSEATEDTGALVIP